MNREITGFLHEGVKQYARACDTVGYFERELKSTLAGVLTSRRWKIFQPTGVPESHHGEDTLNGFGRWILSGLAVDLRSAGASATINVGIWWGAPGLAHATILFANFTDATFSKHPFHSRTSGVSAASTCVGVHTRLYMPPPMYLDFDRDFGLLLDELERHPTECHCETL